MPQALSAKPAPGIRQPFLTPCILVDDPEQLQLLSEMISEIGYDTLPASGPEEALRLAQTGGCRVLLVDEHLPIPNAHAFLDRVLGSDPAVYVIVLSSEYTTASALEAMRRGAADFLPKPVERLRLKRTLDHIAALHNQRRRVLSLEDQLLPEQEFQGMVGRSPAMLEVFEFARKVARHYRDIFLVGPAGSGKKLLAAAIHKLSPASQQRLAVCNCSALLGTLPERQLFGHARGAFAGATDSRPGLFEYADGGAVVLDEVGEMSLAVQARLLRVIQAREVQRVGGSEIRRVNVHTIAATNRDLRAEVLAGRFREDLFHRLSSVQIRIPSLVEHLEDIPPLVQFFLKKYNQSYGKAISGLTRRAHTALWRHRWPGNVRELENVIAGAAIAASGDFIDLADLPECFQHPQPFTAGGSDCHALSLEEVRKVHIQRVLGLCLGNRLRAAQALGIGRTSLYRYLKRDRAEIVPAQPASARPKSALASRR